MKAINKKDLLRKAKFRKEQKAMILVDNGVCSLQADVDVMGIQFEFNGTAEITPQLPEGWILQGNAKRMIIITLQGNPIQNQALFNYKGNKTPQIGLMAQDVEKVNKDAVVEIDGIKRVYYGKAVK